VRVCRIEADGTLPVVEEAGAGPHWIDFTGGSEKWLAWLADASARPAIQHAAASPGGHLQFVSRPGWIYVSVPLKNVDPDEPMPHLHATVSADRLTTCADEPGGEVLHELSVLVDDDRVPCSSPLRVLVGILVLALDDTVESSRKLREELGRVADLLDNSPGEVTVEDVRLLRRRAGRLSALCEDQLLAISSLEGLELEKLEPDAPRREIRRQLDMYAHLPASISRLHERASELNAAVQLNLSERAESRLRLLSIVSAIFLPLSLLAGVYGMNFENMPELKYPAAYYVCLGAMGAVGLGMIVLFWRKGWFD